MSASSRVVFLSLLVLALSLGLATADSSHAQVPYDNPRVAHGPRAEAAAAIPNFRWRVRELNIGNISVALTNSGMVEYGHFPDACSGIETGAVTFPKGSYNVFLGHSLWIGGVKDGDTLVSTMRDWTRSNGLPVEILEVLPGLGEQSEFVERTSRAGLRRGFQCSDLPFDSRAVSEHDMISSSTDTITDPRFVEINPVDQRRHQPLGIKLSTDSYSWSYDYAEDFVIVNYRLENVGYREVPRATPEAELNGLYVGVLSWWGIN